MATDQEIRDAGFKYIPQQQYLQNPFELPEDQEPIVDQGIVATNAFTNSGGGDGNYYSGSPNELVGNYQSIIDARQKRLNNPSNTFLGFNTMKDQQLTGADAGFYDTIPQEMTMMGKVQNFLTPQSAESILKDGYQPKTNIGIISNILGRFDNYGNLPRADQAFIAQNMGYTGPTVFGDNTSGLSKDPFGLNTRSAFGNYAERVGVEVDKLSDALSSTGAIGGKKDFQGATFNPETGMFEAAEESDLTPEQIDALNQRTKMVRTKLNFYRNKNLEYEDLVNKNAELQGIQDTKIAKDFIDKNPNYGDPEKNINPGSGGGSGYDPGADYSGSDKRSEDNRSSDLGFSDIRLKENVELIGKSPSNINIYKFNYKNNPTIYQGAMAHEVPWASVKHSNGYMMVDYNQIDVDFKKI